jgi:ATP-dependent Lon protease
MSGRKYSEVELANNVREALRCQVAAQEALIKAESLVSVLNEVAGTTEALESAAEIATDTLNQIRQELKSINEQFDHSSLMQLDLAEVRRRKAAVERLQTKLATIIRQCRDGQSAAGLRMELARVANELESNQGTLTAWLPDIYDAYAQETNELLKHADKELRATGRLSTLEQQILAHTGAFQGMVDQSLERKSQDAERRYIANALLKICKQELGFSASLLPQNHPLDDLIVEVNTFAYGIINFRLQLDGTIRSQSEMVTASCPANFKEIEKQLHSLGVISNFRYEGDQSPVVFGDNAVSAPREQTIAQERRGSS